MLFKARFKEKTWIGVFEGVDDWDTVGGWDAKIEAPNLARALEQGAKRCRALEAIALAQGERIKVSVEIECRPHP